jgi:hypothetical protein
MDKLLITVKDNCQTYTARCNGKSASCTANPETAAINVAKKVLPGCEFTLESQPEKRSHYFTYLATPKEMPHV